MLTKDLEYNLPDERIAKYPPEKRGSTRLMVIDRSDGSIKHDKYSNLHTYLREHDVLVLNNTKVMKSRLHFSKGEKTHEVLLLSNIGDKWECLISRSRKLKKGEILTLKDDHKISIKIEDKLKDSVWIVSTDEDLHKIFDEHGHVPIPPYMNREDTEDDEIRYNTVFGKELGSSASPTASINFTEDLLERIEKKGISLAYVTLDVGWGTFSPIRDDIVEEHKIHKEGIRVPVQTAETIQNSRSKNGRVIAAGTTAARTIETVANPAENSFITEYEGETELFIYPGYEWKAVDVLLTNFHAPRTSLLAMIGSFMGVELMRKAYQEALEEGYDFLSYGDSMLIL